MHNEHPFIHENEHLFIHENKHAFISGNKHSFMRDLLCARPLVDIGDRESNKISFFPLKSSWSSGEPRK